MIEKRDAPGWCSASINARRASIAQACLRQMSAVIHKRQCANNRIYAAIFVARWMNGCGMSLATLLITMCL